MYEIQALPTGNGEAMTDQERTALIERLTQRFLGWKLPANFNPDGGISFDPIANKGYAFESRREPVGTNLLDADQARQMFEYLLAVETTPSVVCDLCGRGLEHSCYSPANLEADGGRNPHCPLRRYDAYAPSHRPADAATVQKILKEATERRASAEQSSVRGMSERMFPIMGYHDIPWRAIAPAEKQAQENHGQSLERLAERGGLSPCEACAVMQFRPWKKMDDGIAREVLDKLVLIELERQTKIAAHPQEQAAPTPPVMKIIEGLQHISFPLQSEEDGAIIADAIALLQSVAVPAVVEPPGCPTPGACSCTKAHISARPGITREQIAQIIEQGMHSVEWTAGKRPSIAELEAILNSSETPSISLLPDGSITAGEPRDAAYKCAEVIMALLEGKAAS
jgi:hypothetical protein